MQLTIRHTTHYTYDAPVDYGLQQVRLRPLETSQQNILNWSLDVEGGKIETSYTDHNGNHVDLLSVTRGSTSIAITAQGAVETIDTAGILARGPGAAAPWYYLSQTPLTAPGDSIKALSDVVRDAADTLNALHDLSHAILQATPYLIGETYAATTAEEALNGNGGVCQDHAQIFVSAARAAGIPARYVSGYLMMNDRVDQDASHAWAEALVDGLGWIGFDVSNGISPDTRYVRLAVGLDYRQAAPISGLRLSNANETMVVSLQVEQ